MTCAEFLEVAEAFAISALDPEEQRAAEAHLAAASHQDCPQALARAGRGWEALARSLPPIRPSAQVWAVIESRIGSPRAAARRRSSWPLGLAAAAGLLVAALFYTRATQERGRAAALSAQLEDLRAQVSGQRQALALLQSPTSIAVPLAPQSGAAERASAILDLDHHAALVMASALRLQAGRDYELWVIRGGAKLPAGLLRASADGFAMVHIDEQLLRGGAPDALAVTLEPNGGSPQPTGAILLLGKVPKA